MGLFGTVVGIMRAFNEIGVQKKAGIEVVGPGIAEALITTACGIAVGIVAVVVYNYFQSRLGRLATELRLIAEEFVELLREQKAASSTTGTATATVGEPAPAQCRRRGGSGALDIGVRLVHIQGRVVLNVLFLVRLHAVS